jgi:hypothetical protein
MQTESVDWKAYSSWLSKEGYQPSTIDATLRNLRVVCEALSDIGNLQPHYEPHIKRYLRFVDHSRKNMLGGSAFLKKLQKAGYEPASNRRKHGRRTKDPLILENWKRLKDKLQIGDDISRLLWAYMLSGVRVSEFLNSDIRVTALSTPLPQNWKVYRVLGDSNKRSVYSRMRKRLQEVAEELNLGVDLDTLYKSRSHLQ